MTRTICGSVSVLLVSLCLIQATPGSRAQTSGNQDALLEQARSHAEARHWEKAIEALNTLIESNPSHAQAWFEKGTAHLRLNQFHQALIAFEKAEQYGATGFLLALRAADAAASLGRNAASLQWLEKAVESGLPLPVLKEHPDLENIRARLGAEPGFKTVIEKAERRAFPCKHDRIYSELDFWVGEWNVFIGDQLAGKSTIEKILDDCVILEEWRGTGMNGKSFNYYDPSSGKWRQHWVDSRGGNIVYEGEIQEGSMRFTGEQVTVDGKKYLSRMVLSPVVDGGVRQLIERSQDDGETWSVYFDGRYVRRRN